jgi:hypothetical protein
MRRASELGHAEATYKLGRELLMQAAVAPPPPPGSAQKGRKGRRKKPKKGEAAAEESGGGGGGGVSFSTSDPNFEEGHALLKRAATFGHEGAAGLAAQLDGLVAQSGGGSRETEQQPDEKGEL